MLDLLGYDSLDELAEATVPAAIRMNARSTSASPAASTNCWPN